MEAEIMFEQNEMRGKKHTKNHRNATWRSKKNNISAIRRSDGSLSKDFAEIKGITNSFFKDLRNTMINPSHIISLVKPAVNEDMYKDLCKPFAKQ